MKSNSLILREIVHQIQPSLLSLFNWFDIWERPLDGGTAYEWTVFASLINGAEKQGWKITYPILEYPELKDLFVFRNEIPYQHGAQAGHSFTANINFSLTERFMTSLLPKAILSKGDNNISVFKEGSPYHKIMYKNDYLDRPDIVLVSGMPTKGFPQIAENSIINFSFDLGYAQNIHGQLRAVDTNLRPIKSRNPSEGLIVPALGIIECSVNKKLDIVKAQTDRYINLFADRSGEPKVLIVTGNNLSDPNLNLLETNLELPASDLRAEFLKVGETAVKIFLQEFA